MRPRIALGVTLAFLLLVLTAFPVSSEPLKCDANYIDSYEVNADARRDDYKVGDVALVDVRVKDGITGAPAGDVDVGVQIEGRGDRWLLAASETNAEGHALVALLLKGSAVEPGWAKALVAAWEPINTPVYCTGRYGYKSYPRLFRIRS